MFWGDGGEASIECEEFYSILNNIDGNGKSIDIEEVLDDVRSFFETYMRVAEQQRKELESYKNYTVA